jgi:NAD(P)-dependent dehydrogenase (short-subunit alcohol dehydrogenase family)
MSEAVAFVTGWGKCAGRAVATKLHAVGFIVTITASRMDVEAAKAQ